MSVDFRIFPKRGLVYIWYEGHVALEDTFAAIERYARHPDFRPAQKQLVDLSRATGFQSDFVELLKLQARKADVFCGGGLETLIVYYAPNQVSRDLAKFAMRSWEEFDHVIARVQNTEDGCLALLGERETNFQDLIARADSV